MVNKKVVILMSILSIAITVAIVYFSLRPLQNNSYTFEEKDSENNTIIIKNKPTEVITDTNENKEEIDNTVKEESNKVNEENKTNEQVTKKTGKELAIEMAKKEWGEKDTSVYYYVEEKKSEDVYIISVRNKETTAGMMDYEVNLKTGKVEEY